VLLESSCGVGSGALTWIGGGGGGGATGGVAILETLIKKSFP
jgi:hypothetical protein